MNRQKHISPIIAAVTLAVLAVSCAQQQKYAYVSDAPRGEEKAIANNYSTTIFPGDQLYIYVYSQNQAAVKPFNEETRDAVPNSSDKPLKGYFVDDDGYIQYPILGAISTKGLTLDGLAREIEARMVEGRYVKDPMVTVSLMNFRVTVIGEITRPQLLHGNGNRMTIFEAIAQCGDVTMDGIRTNVKVIRTNGNIQTIDSVDLTSKTVLESPYYYLHSGDIVYIEPTPRKKRIAWRDDDWPRYLQIGTQAVRLAYTTVRYYYIMNR